MQQSDKFPARIQATVSTLREYQRSGQYVAANAFIQALDNAVIATPVVMLQVARLYMRQGCMNRAKALLSNTETWEGTAGEILWLQLEKASLSAFTQLSFKQAISQAEDAIASLETQILPAEKAEARRIYIRILLTAAIYWEVPQSTAEKSISELPTLAEVLEAAGLVDEALAARFTFAERQKGYEQKLRSLQILAEHAVSIDYRHVSAEAHARRAEILLKTGASNSEIYSELERAERLYNSANHVIGTIDVERLRAELQVNREFASPQLWQTCLERYKAQDYPKGEISVLLDLSQQFHIRGDTAAAISARQEILNIAETSGMKIAEDSCQLALIDLLMRNNSCSTAIELCEAALDQELPVFNRACYWQLMSTAYAFVQNYDKSIATGRQAISLFEKVGAGDSASVAVLRLASDLDSLREEGSWQQAITLLEEWTEKDKAREDFESALGKQEMIAQIKINQYYYSPERRYQADTLEQAQQTIEEAMELAATLLPPAQDKRMASLYQLRGQLKQASNDWQGVIDTWEAALKIYRQAGLQMEASNCQYILGALQLNLANQDLLAHFGKAETLFNECLSFYDEAVMRSHAADTRYMLAKLYRNAAPRVTRELGEQLLDAALEQLQAAEANYDDIRRDYATGSVVDAQHAKQSIVGKSKRVYGQALEILLYLREDSVLAWQWAQKSKARALSDMLGTSIQLPVQMQASLEKHPSALAMLSKEKPLVERLVTASGEDKMALRQELAQLRAQMAEESALSDYLEIKTGIALELDDMAALFEKDEENACVCVDWLDVEGELWLVALRPDQMPIARKLALTLAQVQAFINQNLSSEAFRSTLRDTPEILSVLDPLIAPLAELTEPEEHLVLVPTGLLHAVPLHALQLGGKLLIERNLVSYCPSLSILRQCISRQRQTDGQAAALTLLGDPSGDRLDAAQLVEYLSQRYLAKRFISDQVDRNTFIQQLQQSDILHFQGHAQHSPSGPLSSFLLLSDGELSAREIFTLSGVSAELVTLGACESAANVIKTGDEPLGLIPAFLFAGVNSVLASLWKASSPSAALFMKAFYDEINRPEKPNKAVALRKAMLEVRSHLRYDAPYYWAPFVLNGDWHSLQ